MCQLYKQNSQFNWFNIPFLYLHRAKLFILSSLISLFNWTVRLLNLFLFVCMRMMFVLFAEYTFCV